MSYVDVSEVVELGLPVECVVVDVVLSIFGDVTGLVGLASVVDVPDDLSIAGQSIHAQSASILGGERKT